MAAERIDWHSVEKFMLLGNTYKQASEHFKIIEGTIRKRASRYQWPLPHKIAQVKAEIQAQPARNAAIVEQTAKNLAERGEEHAKVVFDLASNALASLKKLPVRNWKDAEIADKAARRAAGMGNDDEGARVSIIQLNESLNSHDFSHDEVLEADATLIPGTPASELQDTPEAQHDGSQEA